MSKFAKYLKDRKITRKKLSEEVGANITNVELWVNGQYMPSIENQKKIAEFLDITVDELRELLKRENPL
jgi:transcriptional regulator with XRE-family HTH domain